MLWIVLEDPHPLQELFGCLEVQSRVVLLQQVIVANNVGYNSSVQLTIAIWHLSTPDDVSLMYSSSLEPQLHCEVNASIGA